MLKYEILHNELFFFKLFIRMIYIYYQNVLLSYFTIFVNIRFHFCNIYNPNREVANFVFYGYIIILQNEHRKLWKENVFLMQMLPFSSYHFNYIIPLCVKEIYNWPSTVPLIILKNENFVINKKNFQNSFKRIHIILITLFISLYFFLLILKFTNLL